jgi:hypothetical protein
MFRFPGPPIILRDVRLMPGKDIMWTGRRQTALHFSAPEFLWVSDLGHRLPDTAVRHLNVQQ